MPCCHHCCHCLIRGSSSRAGMAACGGGSGSSSSSGSGGSSGAILFLFDVVILLLFACPPRWHRPSHFHHPLLFPQAAASPLSMPNGWLLIALVRCSLCRCPPSSDWWWLCPLPPATGASHCSCVNGDRAFVLSFLPPSWRCRHCWCHPNTNSNQQCWHCLTQSFSLLLSWVVARGKVVAAEEVDIVVAVAWALLVRRWGFLPIIIIVVHPPSPLVVGCHSGCQPLPAFDAPDDDWLLSCLLLLHHLPSTCDCWHFCCWPPSLNADLHQPLFYCSWPDHPSHLPLPLMVGCCILPPPSSIPTEPPSWKPFHVPTFGLILTYLLE